MSTEGKNMSPGSKKSIARPLADRMEEAALTLEAAQIRLSADSDLESGGTSRWSPVELRRVARLFREIDKAKTERENLIEQALAVMHQDVVYSAMTNFLDRTIAARLVDEGWRPMETTIKPKEFHEDQ